MNANVKARWLLAGLLGSFAVLRTVLWVSPNVDFNVMGHNIHHLFTGLLLMTISGPPLLIGAARQAGQKLLLMVFGAGLGMALDEWVYLVMTDGSNASYLLPVSFVGGAIAVGLAALWIIVLANRND